MLLAVFAPSPFRVEGMDNFRVRNKRSASSVDDKTDHEGTEEEEEEMGNETLEKGSMIDI